LVNAGSAQAPLPVVEQRNPAFAPFQVELGAKSGFCGEVDVPASTTVKACIQGLGVISLSGNLVQLP